MIVIKIIVLIVVVLLVLLGWGLCALIGGIWSAVTVDNNQPTIEKVKIEVQETDLRIREKIVDTKNSVDSVWDKEYDKYLESLEKEIKERRENLRN